MMLKKTEDYFLAVFNFSLQADLVVACLVSGMFCGFGGFFFWFFFDISCTVLKVTLPFFIF